MNALVLLAAAVVSQPSPDADVRCSSLRLSRQLALAERLDDSTLVALEQRHCAAPRPPEVHPNPPRHHPPHVPPHFRPSARAGRDCEDLSTMARLARLGAAPQDLVAAVEGQRVAACALGDQPRAAWPNGVTAKYADGSWNYPTGVRAKYSDGSWNYPSGVRARYADGTWNYPNGVRARYADGTWSSPNGARANERDVLAAACRAEPRRCEWLAASAGSLEGDERTLALLELAWAQSGR